MAKELHDTADQISVTLDGFHNDSTLSFQLSSGDGTVIDGAFTLPAFFVFDSEQVSISAVDTGTDIATLERGVNQTSPASHNDLTVGHHRAIAGQINEIHEALAIIYGVMFQAAGGSDGVIENDNEDSLLVVAQSTPDMTVKFKAGVGFVSGKPIYDSADTDSSTLTAPTGDPRIDTVQEDHYGTITILTGSEAGSPSAPDPESNNIKRAVIYHRVGSIHIDNDDDSSNSYITDARVML